MTPNRLAQQLSLTDREIELTAHRLIERNARAKTRIDNYWDLLAAVADIHRGVNLYIVHKALRAAGFPGKRFAEWD